MLIVTTMGNKWTRSIDFYQWILLTYWEVKTVKEC